MSNNTTKSNDCRIYLVTMRLDKNGFSHQIHSIDCTETTKMYVTHSKRIAKEKVMKIDSHIIPNHRCQHFFTFCLEGQQQEALDMLRLHIIDEIKTVKSEVDKLFAFVI